MSDFTERTRVDQDRVDRAEIISGGVFIFLGTYLVTSLLPTPLIATFPSVAIALVVLVFACAVLEAVFSGATGIYLPNLIVGGAIVYAIWSLFLEVALGPSDGPDHLILGVLLLIGFGAGAGLVELAARAGLVRRRTLFGEKATVSARRRGIATVGR